MKRVIDISGEWELFCDKTKKEPFPEFFYDKIILPDTLSRACKTEKSEEVLYDSLTDIYKFEGFAWFQKKIYFRDIKDDETAELFLERTRKTKVFFDGKFLGQRNSLCTPHRYILPSGCGEHILTILVDNTDYPTCGGHMTSCDTQTNWIGITGKMEIRIYGSVYCKNIMVDTNCMSSGVRVVADVCGKKEGIAHIYIDGMERVSVLYDDSKIDAVYKPSEKLKLWDEYNRNIYTLKIEVEGDLSCADFGLRRIDTEGLKLKINKREVFLRGKHDGMIFPINISAPTDVEAWTEVMSTAMEYGINHYRFHTCCPPDAAFEAADRLGIYMEPELPFWGTIKSVQDEDFNEDEYNFLLQEGFNILREFGNHPSFIMMSMGNELWGNREVIEKMLSDYKTYDNRRLYSSGSNNFQFCPEVFKNEDVFSGVRLGKERLIRGSYAMCDAPLGFVQTDLPNTVHNFDSMIFPEKKTEAQKKTSEDFIDIQYKTQTRRVKALSVDNDVMQIGVPVISHETGQYAMYPDFNERSKYNGSLQPFYLDKWKQELEKRKLFHMSDKFFKASSQLSFACYKLEIEAAMKSRYLSGFQLLDLQDFTGQGIALVGILNSFMKSKGIVEADVFRGFCGDFVVMAGFRKFVYTVGETIKAQIFVSCTRQDIEPCDIRCFVNEKEYCSFRFYPQEDRVSTIGMFEFDTSTFLESSKICVTFENEDGSVKNSYEIWIYTDSDIVISETYIEYLSEKIHICSTDKEAQRYIESGEKAFVVLPFDDESVKVSYCTDFWNYHMFSYISKSMSKPLPIGTLGLCIDDKNIAMKHFLSSYYTTPQWYDVIVNSHCKVLDGDASDVIVEAIDNTDHFRRLGILFRKNDILHCTCQIWKKPDSISIKKFTESILKLI